MGVTFGGPHKSSEKIEGLEEIQEVVESILEVLKYSDVFIALGKSVIDTAKPKFVKAATEILGTCADINQELAPALARLSNQSAETTHRDYQNLIRAGFDRDQAFQLVLAKIKSTNFSEVIKTNVVKGVKEEVSEFKKSKK